MEPDRTIGDSAEYLSRTNGGLTLYDGARLSGEVPPEAQGWLAFAGYAAARRSVGGVTRIRSVRGLPGGYSNYELRDGALRVVNAKFPSLDEIRGFTIEFAVALLAEDHDNSDKNGDSIGDRAGLSVLVVTEHLKAIELAFWNDDPDPRMRDRIWAQEDGSSVPPTGALFTHTAEGAWFDTSALTEYRLSVRKDGYSLSAGISTTPILAGQLRDYTAFDTRDHHAKMTFNPYRTRNYFFLGDDTQSACAEVILKSIRLITH